MSRRMLRCFVAVDVDPEVARALEREIGHLQLAGGDVGWTSAKNLHITLRFLGDVAPEEIVTVARTIRKCCEGIEACRLRVHGVTAFPNADDPHFIFAAVEDESGTVHELFRRLQVGMRELGFRPETKPLRLHITLGRVRSSRNIEELKARLAASVDQHFGEISIDHVNLMMSDLKGKSPDYTVMETFDLIDIDLDDAEENEDEDDLTDDADDLEFDDDEIESADLDDAEEDDEDDDEEDDRRPRRR